MRSLPFLFIALAACEEATELPAAQLPPAAVQLEAPPTLLTDRPATASVFGDIMVGEIVYLLGSDTAGAGPCPRNLGGTCLSIKRPRVLGQATVTRQYFVDVPFTLPATAPPGDGHLQAVVVRGWRGAATLVTNVKSVAVETPASGCTDPHAENYDPVANEDDGSCVVPDLSQWTRRDFLSEDSRNPCVGGAKYVRTTGYDTGHFVGVQLCSGRQLKIFLSDELNGTFWSISDRCDLGEDHCEFVGGTWVGGSGAPGEGLTGYSRCNDGETPAFGTMTAFDYTPWVYDCGVTIP